MIKIEYLHNIPYIQKLMGIWPKQIAQSVKSANFFAGRVLVNGFTALFQKRESVWPKLHPLTKLLGIGTAPNIPTLSFSISQNGYSVKMLVPQLRNLENLVKGKKTVVTDPMRRYIAAKTRGEIAIRKSTKYLDQRPRPLVDQRYRSILQSARSGFIGQFQQLLKGLTNAKIKTS